jgi:DNA mismatch endonuclease, patch repair protein
MLSKWPSFAKPTTSTLNACCNQWNGSAMTDVFSSEKRSQIMSRVRGTNTRPEVIVRSIIHRMGFRYRLHRRDLPGIPDIVLSKLGKVVLVHGCFWHGHPRCRKSARPQSNSDFWIKKLDRNIARDKANQRALRRLGWRVLVVWECQLKSVGVVQKRLKAFLYG